MASKKKKRIINSFKYLFLIMGSFVMIVPFIWMISTSFKGTSEIFTFPPIWIPKEPTLRGYVRLLTNNRMPFLAFFKKQFYYYFNSCYYTGIYQCMRGICLCKTKI